MPVSQPTAAERALKLGSRAVRAVAGLLVLAAAYGIFALLMETAKEPSQTEVEQVLTVVGTVPVQSVRVPRQWEGYGTARAMHSADVSAQLTARVKSRPQSLEEGVRIAAGEVIAELDAVDVDSALASQQSAATAIESELVGLEVELRSLNERLELGDDELAIEQRMLDRFNEAQSRGGANPMDIDLRQALVRRLERDIASLRQQVRLIDSRRARLEAQLAEANARVRKSQEDVARATIRSPLNGIVQRIDVEVGELLTAGSMVARIVDLRTIEIPLRMPVSSSTSIRVGDRVEVRTDSARSGRWDGTVARIAPEADAGRRTITVYAEVRQQAATGGSLAALLLPGQFVIGRVFSAVGESHAIVPRSSLNGDRVLAMEPTIDGGFVARSRPVVIEFQFSGEFPTIHPLETQWAAVRSGDAAPLPERVIVSNLEMLRDGARVRPEGTEGASALTAEPVSAEPDAGKPGADG